MKEPLSFAEVQELMRVALTHTGNDVERAQCLVTAWLRGYHEAAR